MSHQETQILTHTTASPDVISFLVEQFGVQVRELADQFETSSAKVKYKGEKDELANFVEGIHFKPIDTTIKGIENATYYLNILLHNKLMRDVFIQEQKRIDYIYITKNLSTYLLKLSKNTFEERDFFRTAIDNFFDDKSYSHYVNVDCEFIPDDVNENEIISEYVTKIELKKFVA